MRLLKTDSFGVLGLVFVVRESLGADEDVDGLVQFTRDLKFDLRVTASR